MTVEMIKLLAGYKKPRPMVYCGVFPTYPAEYENLPVHTAAWL